jgi:hypothetical protein
MVVGGSGNPVVDSSVHEHLGVRSSQGLLRFGKNAADCDKYVKGVGQSFEIAEDSSRGLQQTVTGL